MSSSHSSSHSDALEQTLSAFDAATAAMLSERRRRVECERKLAAATSNQVPESARPRVSLGFGDGDEDDDEDDETIVSQALIKTISIITTSPIPPDVDDAPRAVRWASDALRLFQQRAVAQTRNERFKHSLTEDQALKAMELMKSLTELLDAEDPSRIASEASPSAHVT